jgi:fructokinase
MRKDPLILSFGDIIWDQRPSGLSLGGSAATFAGRVAALGRTVRLVGAVGADEAGDRALRELQSFGVDTALVQKAPGLSTSVAQTLVSSDGTPSCSPAGAGASGAVQENSELLATAEYVEVLYWNSSTQREPVAGATLKEFLRCGPPSFKVYDVDCSWHLPTREDLENSLEVASVVSLRGRDISKVCELLGLPDLEPGLLAPAMTERFGVSYCTVSDPLAGALISSIAGEQVGLDLFRQTTVDTLGWHETFLAAFVHHVFEGSSLMRCCGAGMQYGDAVAATAGALAPLSEDVLALVREPG